MEPGQQISANLRLVRVLGRGGMGSVWVADHLGLGTQVAVKTMTLAYAADPDLVERFRREATAALKLKSPHVAQVFDHGIAPNGAPYIVMELLEGEDVGRRVDRTGPQSPPFVAEVVTQVARALARAHDLGIVHRDIKAENVFLTEHGGDLHVKVLDFGIAKIEGGGAASMTATQGTFGTPLYMSPEQLVSAKRVDHRTDVWALAVLTYYMLTGDFPFTGDTVGAIAIAVHEGRFAPASSRRPGLSPAVDAWFARAFQRNVDHRFTSAREAAEALRSALAASATTVPAISAPSIPLSAHEIAHLPTVHHPSSDFSTPDAHVPQRTLAGATISSHGEPRRKAAVLAAGAALAVAAAVLTVVLLRPPSAPSTASGDTSPVRELPASAAAPSVTVAQPSSPASAAPSPSPSPSPSVHVTASSAAPSPSVSAAGRPSSSSKGPTVKPAPTKKDDIGF